MATTIKIKHSTTAGNAPSSLQTGELAINVADGNLFYGDGSGVSQNFTVGTLTAEQYVISSSVTYMTQSFSSGSTIFGDTQDDTHQFTGSVDITGSFTVDGITFPTADGDNGDVLITDGAGNLSFTRTTVYANVKNVHGSELVKGMPVHVTGSVGNTSEVVAASASNAATMPAHFILNETLADDAEGLAIAIGYINGVNTSGFSEGDTVYVGANGGYTNVKPTGSNLIQNLGIVDKVDASNGSGFVLGAGRSNDVPNISPGYAWVGNSDSVATAVATSSFIPAGTVSSSAQITITESQISDLKHSPTAYPLFTYNTSTDPVAKPTSGQFLEIDSITDLILFNSQSLDGVNLAPYGISHLVYDSPGSIFTIIATGSGAYKTYKAGTVQYQENDYIGFSTILTQDIHSSGSISDGDVVYLRVDQSTQVVDFTSAQGNDKLFAGIFDATFNYIDMRYSPGNVGAAPATSLDTTNADIRLLPAISKSADLTIAGLTVNGNITVTGTVDGTDVATLKSDFDTLEGKTLISSSAQFTTSDNVTFGEVTATTNKLAITSTTDGDANGDVVYFGGTTSMITGRIYHYKSDGTWELANPNATATSDGLLGVALGASSDTNGVLLRGMVTLDHDPGAVGDVLYLDEQQVSSNYGAATSGAPAGTGDVVRIIGYCLDATNGQIYFNPSPDFIVHA